MFSQVDVSLNDVLISQSSATYPYRAYIETLLSYGTDAKRSFLSAALWYSDSSSNMDSTEFDLSKPEANSGLVTRSKFFSNSKSVGLVGKLHTDICFQERALLNNITVRLRFIKHSDVFCLMTSDNIKYKLKVTDFYVKVRRLKVLPSIQLSHAQVLANPTSTAFYPIRRIDIKTFTVSKGTKSITHENVFTGQVPEKIILGFVKHTSMTGDYKTNPFNFQHYNVNYLSLQITGQADAYKPYKLCFNENNLNYVEAYFNLFMGIGQNYTNDGAIKLSRDDFKSGYSLFAWDISADQSGNSPYLQLRRSGDINFEIGFDNELKETVNVICYAEFLNTISIDVNRKVAFDYTN